MAATAWWARAAYSGADIICFELAGTNNRAEGVLARWAGTGELAAVTRQTHRDYAFLASYWLPFSLAAANAAQTWQRRGQQRWSRVALAASWLPVAASACDSIENIGLLYMLRHTRPSHAGEPLAELPAAVPAVTTAVATAKFALLILTGGVLIGGYRSQFAPEPNQRAADRRTTLSSFVDLGRCSIPSGSASSDVRPAEMRMFGGPPSSWHVMRRQRA